MNSCSHGDRLADCGVYAQAKPASARQLFLFLNAACNRPSESSTASLSPVFSHLARIVVALLGILMDEAAIDWSEVIFEGRRL
jgi:hypothetical protein